MDAKDLFLAQHAAVQSVAVGGNPASAAERAFAGLSDEQMRVRPREDLNSLAWLMWHIARAEDIMVGALIAGREQVCDDAWRKRLGVSRRASRRSRDRAQRGRLRHGDLMSAARPLRGIIPAMAVPLLDDYKLDEDTLARFAVWLADCRGVTALMTNGHTGEVGSLQPDERAAVTRVVADAVKGRVRVVSAVCAEGTFEAVEHARAAAHAGADAVDVMPCHMWLRFGVREDAVYEYVKAIGGESGLDVIVHVYPTNTRVAYSTRLMLRLASIPQVKGFKMGERDLRAYERDIRALRTDAPRSRAHRCCRPRPRRSPRCRPRSWRAASPSSTSSERTRLSWFVLSLGAALTQAAQFAVVKGRAQAIPPIVIVAWTQAVATLAWLAFFAVSGHAFTWSRSAWPAVLASSLLVTGMATLIARASARGDISVVGPVFALSPVFTVLPDAVLSGTLPSPLGWLGLALAVAGTSNLWRGAAGGRSLRARFVRPGR